MLSEIIRRLTCLSNRYLAMRTGNISFFSYPNMLMDISFCFSNFGISSIFTGNEMSLKFRTESWLLYFQTRSPLRCTGYKAAKTDHMKHLLSLLLMLMMTCFHPIKNMPNCDLDFITLFNSNFDTKALCESGDMWIIRSVTYLSRFPYLLTHYHSFLARDHNK